MAHNGYLAHELPVKPSAAYQAMKFILTVFTILLGLGTLSGLEALTATADEHVSLMGTITKWRYPESKLGGASVSDAATTDAHGDRTVQSIVMKTTMTTEASVEKVVQFYRDLLTQDPAGRSKLRVAPEAGRSVIFDDESKGRPFAFHSILVNTANASTTLFITRGALEDKTRITWKRYSRLVTPQ